MPTPVRRLDQILTIADMRIAFGYRLVLLFMMQGLVKQDMENVK